MPLLLCSVVHTNIPLRLPLRNVLRKSSIHRVCVASVPLVPAKAREGAGGWLLRRRYTVAAVVPLVTDKAREGRGVGCCDGAAMWPPLYLWSRTKLEKGVGQAAAAATVLYRCRRCSVVRTVSHDNNDYHCTAAENTGYHSRGRRCDRCMTDNTYIFTARLLGC